MDSSPAMLNAAEVAAMLRISIRSFDYLVHEGRAPPFIRVGRHRLWRKSDVKRWIEDAFVKASSRNATSRRAR